MQAKLTVKMDKDVIIDSDIFLEFNKAPSKLNTNNMSPQGTSCGCMSNICLIYIAKGNVRLKR